MMERKEIKLVLSADSTKRVRIMATPRNLFCFEEETYVVEVENNDAFWSPTHVSGFYDSAEAAERAAFLELPWLRDQISN
jgi:hypothetical protein